MHVGDPGRETKDAKLARTFVCSSCGSAGAKVKRITTTGAGFSRLLDLQNNEFVVAGCLFCGLVQLYDADLLDKTSTGWVMLDFLTDIG